jgi:hypothetical protein
MKNNKDVVKNLLKIEKSVPHIEVVHEVWRLPDGTIHREFGPAKTLSTGTRCWYRFGKLDREDGPAIVFNDGSGEWWIKGVRVSDPSEVSNAS